MQEKLIAQNNNHDKEMSNLQKIMIDIYNNNEIK